MSNNKCIVFKFKTRWVDLGLPSGTLWARMNVGADNPEDFGLFFSWGNIEGHAAGSGYSFNSSNYDASAGAALTDDIPVSAIYDMARANFGNKAKLPTKEQLIELDNNCTSEWVTVNGMDGIRFTSNINGRSVFFPACGFYDGATAYYSGERGYYWSGTYRSATDGYIIGIKSSEISSNESFKRYRGISVRAVM